MTEQFIPDPSLVQDFLVESEEFLQRMDEDMVKLETNPRDEECLNRIFRAMHTIKGTSGFLGFDPIIRLAHRAEDVLNAIRRGETQFDRRLMDALLGTRDQLGLMLQDLRGGGLKEYNLDVLVAELEEAGKPTVAPLPLGELLVKERIITKDTLGELLSEQAAAEQPRKLGELVVEKGLASPVQVGEVLARQKKVAEVSAQTMRVDTRKLDELINLIGELVLERNRLAQLSHDCFSGRLALADLEFSLSQSTARLSYITDELQAAGLRTRMVPIETVFRRFPRLVRDVACNLQKEVQIEIAGSDTEVDKTMVELITDPLVHLVRNSLDHGIEAPVVREHAGKARQGTIRLDAREEGDQIVVSIADDGAGIRPEHIGQKAVEKGLVTPERLKLLTAREILEFIFLPGFSTAEKVNDLSGRGVGLDVVRSNLKKLNGTIEIESQAGVGTHVRLRLPLTLAILPVLMIEVAGEIYAVPLRSVIETAQINPRCIHRIERSEVLCLREETLPLVRLAEVLGNVHSGNPAAGKVVIIAIAEKRVALLVDRFVGRESTVLKPLGKYLHGCHSFAGATISGDGRVRLVLDPAWILAAAESISPKLGKASA